MPKNRIKGRFAPIRAGLRGHMPRFAQAPIATHVYLWCHLDAERTGPDRGLVTINAADLAREWGWSRNRVVRALRWLTMNPHRDKPYLVRLNGGQRGQAARYYIRNFDGNDPSEFEDRCATSDTSEQLERCAAPCSTSDTTPPKDVSAHAPPAAQPPYKGTRAKTAIQILRPREGFPAIENEDTSPKIAHVFDTIHEMRGFLLATYFAGLPANMASEGLERAMKSPEAYGCGLREADAEQHDEAVGA